MASSLIDPKNHVPELSPDDGWSDCRDWSSAAQTSTTVLPPKKIHLSAPEKNNRAGIKIDPGFAPRPNECSGARLEVREFTRDVVKLVPDIPESAKIPHLFTFHEKPQEKFGKSNAGEGGEWGKSGKQSIRWMLGTGIGVAGLMILGLVALPLINQSNKVHRLPGQTSLVLAPEDLPEAGMEGLNDLIRRQPEAEQIFRNFASAGISADFLQDVRDAKSLAAVIHENQGPARITKAWIPKEECVWNVYEIDGIPCGILEGTLPDYSVFRACFVSEGKRLLLDWKATTGYGTASFVELAKNQGDPTEIRGWIIPSNFYTATFPEADFQCYQLLSPTVDSTLWCYTRKNGPQYSMLEKLFYHGDILSVTDHLVSVTLKLEHSPAGALSNQWLIGKMLHKEWISPY